MNKTIINTCAKHITQRKLANIEKQKKPPQNNTIKKNMINFFPYFPCDPPFLKVTSLDDNCISSIMCYNRI